MINLSGLDVRPHRRFHCPVIQFLVYLEELFLFYVFGYKPVGYVDIMNHHAGHFVSQTFVTAEKVGVVVLFKLFGDLGTPEEAEVGETDGLVRHQPVANAVHQEGGGGCLLVLHAAMVRVDGTGEGDDTGVVEIVRKDLGDCGAVAQFIICLKHRDGAGAAPAKNDPFGRDVEFIGVFQQEGGGIKEVFRSHLDGLVQRLDDFQPAKIHAFQPETVVNASYGIAQLGQLFGVLHVFGGVALPRDEAAAENKDDAVAVRLGRGRPIQVEVQAARVTLDVRVGDGL